MTSIIRTALILAILAAATPQAQQKDAPSLAGTWRGSVTADRGEMAIALTIAIDKEIARGDLATDHGTFRITNGTLTAGTWTLPFETPDGAKGKMTGVVKGDTFSGEWDFRPMAFGKFTARRQK